MSSAAAPTVPTPTTKSTNLELNSLLNSLMGEVQPEERNRNFINDTITELAISDPQFTLHEVVCEELRRYQGIEYVKAENSMIPIMLTTLLETIREKREMKNRARGTKYIFRLDPEAIEESKGYGWESNDGQTIQFNTLVEAFGFFDAFSSDMTEYRCIDQRELKVEEDPWVKQIDLRGLYKVPVLKAAKLSAKKNIVSHDDDSDDSYASNEDKPSYRHLANGHRDGDRGSSGVSSAQGTLTADSLAPSID
jgi:hypothetical protein